MSEQKPTYEELEQKVEDLLNSNDKLSRHITGFSGLFEQNKRELMAHGWDACADKVEKDLTDVAPAYAASVKIDNPFRKPLDIPGVSE